MTPATHSLTLVRPEPPTDTALCRAFLDGDTKAFGELVRRHQETVYRVVRRYASNTDEAFDLGQRAFLQAFAAARRTLPRLDQASGGEIPFRAWVLRIAINLAKNHARQDRRWKTAPLESVEVRCQTESPLGITEANAKTHFHYAVKRLREEVQTLSHPGGTP